MEAAFLYKYALLVLLLEGIRVTCFQEVAEMTVHETYLIENQTRTLVGALCTTSIAESALTGFSFGGISVGRDYSEGSKEFLERAT